MNGTGTAPALVLALIEGLDETSLLFAAQNGPEWRGWNEDRHLLASIYDALNMNTLATGNWKKGKTPDIPPWPRPDKRVADRKDKKKKASVADLYGRFVRAK